MTLVLPRPRQIIKPKFWRPILSHLQLVSGHLAYTAGNHLSKCADTCPGLGDVDWYLYLCVPSLPSVWCPTEDFIDVAINLGTLSTGTNTIALSDYQCTSMTHDYYCPTSTLDTSTGGCTVDFTSANIDVEVANITNGYSFDITLYADVDDDSCSGSAYSTTATLLESDPLSGAAGSPATCVSGVYSAGEYVHQNIGTPVILCNGVDNGRRGYYINASANDIAPTDFYVAPLASLPTC